MRMRRQRFCSILFHSVSWAFVAVLATCFQANAAVMKAGVARANITSAAGVQMWDYFNRLKRAEGTIDPLYARVLVLEAGDSRLAYVDLDLGRTFGPASIERLRRAAKQDGINDLIVQAVHMHAEPVIIDHYPSGTPAWQTAVLAKIEDAIREAHDHAVAVRLGAGYRKAYIGYNRRRINPDGMLTMIWNNSTRVPTWPVDPTVAVLRIDRMDGQLPPSWRTMCVIL